MASTTTVNRSGRVTKRSIRERVIRLQRTGADIKIDSAYGQDRMVDSREANLSLRGTPGQLDLWLDGYETARRQIEYGRHRITGAVVAAGAGDHVD